MKLSNTTYKFSEEKTYYYTVLNKLINLRKQRHGFVSASELQEKITYFIIPIDRIEKILDELYNYSFLMREEISGKEFKYRLMVI